MDKRADIWAFGVVRFEMLTGTWAFPGEDMTDTLLAAVVRSEPQWDALPPTVPARVSQALRVCLRKDPKQRASDIRDVRLSLEGAFETVAPLTPAVASVVSCTRERVAWMALGVVSLAALALAARRPFVLPDALSYTRRRGRPVHSAGPCPAVEATAPRTRAVTS